MFLPFQSFEDGTELVCTPWKNGSTTVLLETPDEQYTFKTLKLTIPGCQIQSVYGFDSAETEYWLAFCKEHEEEIIEFTKKYRWECHL